MLHRSALLLVLGLTLTGCGTYRTGTGGYRGMGAYKTPAEYSLGADTGAVDSAPASEEEMTAARGHLSGRSQYVPRYPFKLYWPVSQVRINRGFHPPSDPAHSGLDLGGKKGTAILAAHEGVVIYAGRDFRGYGNMMLVEYNDEWATLYGHLDDFIVKENTLVAPGDPIASMGATGHATGVHLHFEVMHNHQPVDPLTLLTSARSTAAVKPTMKRKPSRSRRRVSQR